MRSTSGFAFSLIANSKGSTLGIVIAAMGMLGVATMTTIGVSEYLNKASRLDAETRDVDAFATTIENLMTNSVSCYGTVNGQPRTTPAQTAIAGDFTGLRFYPTSGGGAASRSNFSPAASPHQDVVIGGLITNSAGTKDIGKGLSFATANVRVNNLYIENIETDGTTPNLYKARLMLDASVISNPTHEFAPRTIGSVTIRTDGAGALLGCVGTIPAQGMCERMGCKFNPADTIQKCNCGFPDMDCNAGISASAPRKYLAGYDASTNTPVCKDIEITCESKGPGYFFVGMDSYGQPICLTLEANTVTTTTTLPANGCWTQSNFEPDAGWNPKGMLIVPGAPNFSTSSRATAEARLGSNHTPCTIGTFATYSGPATGYAVNSGWEYSCVSASSGSCLSSTTTPTPACASGVMAYHETTQSTCADPGNTGVLPSTGGYTVNKGSCYGLTAPLAANEYCIDSVTNADQCTRSTGGGGTISAPATWNTWGGCVTTPPPPPDPTPGPRCACYEVKYRLGGVFETSGDCQVMPDAASATAWCDQMRAASGGKAFMCSASANPPRCGLPPTTTTTVRVPRCYSKDWGFQAGPGDCDTRINFTSSAACPKPSGINTGICGHLDSSCDPVYPGDPLAYRCP